MIITAAVAHTSGPGPGPGAANAVVQVYIVLVLQQCTNRHNEVVQVAFACFKYSG